DCPIIDGATLPIFDVFIIGIPTSCGDFPDRKVRLCCLFPPLPRIEQLIHLVATGIQGQQWANTDGAVVSTAGLAHHGIIFVPLRCASTLDQLTVVRIVYCPFFF
ncbi:hypothetical protein B0H14DRAFT_2365109, partial [Mycena olivaceomarginata]